MKKIPMRKCVVTQEQFPKKELIRVVRTPEGNVVIDKTGRTNGRGAYLKKDPEVIELAKKRKALVRALECEVEDSLYEELLGEINGSKN